MARYFFDVDDGERRTIDRDGHDMTSLAAVRAAAVGVLPAIAADAPTDRDTRMFRVKVRDGAGRHVFHASLVLVVRWMS